MNLLMLLFMVTVTAAQNQNVSPSFRQDLDINKNLVLSDNTTKEFSLNLTNSSVETNTENLEKKVLSQTNMPKTITKLNLLNASASNKHIPVSVLQYLKPYNIIRPISQKLSKLSDVLTQPYQPNDGVVNLLNPAYWWDRIYAKGQKIIANANSAIFGFSPAVGQDYPFPYRFN